MFGNRKVGWGMVVGALLLASALYAQNEVVLANMAPGTYRLKIVVDAAGKVTVTPLTTVDMGGGGGGGPGPVIPPPVDPPVDSQLKKTTTMLTQTAIVSGGTLQTATTLYHVVKTVRDKVNDGTVPIESVFGEQGAVKQSLDLVLDSVPDGDRWVAWRTGVGNELGKMQTNNQLNTKAQIVGAFTDIINGLQSVVASAIEEEQRQARQTGKPIKEGEGILDNINIEQIIKLVELIIRLLEAFKTNPAPGGGGIGFGQEGAALASSGAVEFVSATLPSTTAPTTNAAAPQAVQPTYTQPAPVYRTQPTYAPCYVPNYQGRRSNYQFQRGFRR